MPPATSPTIDPTTRAAVDRWLTRRGVPHLITGYSAREDVLTRALPLLAAVFVLEMAFALDLDWPLWGNALAILGGGALLLGGYAGINRLSGRRPLSLPRRVGNGEIATFLLLPALLPVVFGGDLTGAASAIAGNAILLLLVYVVTSYGLVPMVRWALGHTGRHVGAIGHLAARALPMLLLFSTFLFVNAEIWQVAAGFTAATFAATVLLFVGAGLIFFMLRLPRQTAEIATFADWAQVIALTEHTPAAEVVPSRAATPADVAPLSRPDRVNIALLLVVAQGVQILLVAALIGAFFMVFGLVAIREDTILAWTAAESLEPIARLTVWDTPLVLSTELVRVATFIAAFTGLQFTVSASTDESWRAEFVDDVVAEVREALAVRWRCLAAAPPAER